MRHMYVCMCPCLRNQLFKSEIFIRYTIFRFSGSRRFHRFFLLAAIDEKLNLPKHNVSNVSRTFVSSEYSCISAQKLLQVLRKEKLLFKQSFIIPQHERNCQGMDSISTSNCHNQIEFPCENSNKAVVLNCLQKTSSILVILCLATSSMNS